MNYSKHQSEPGEVPHKKKEKATENLLPMPDNRIQGPQNPQFSETYEYYTSFIRGEPPPVSNPTTVTRPENPAKPRSRYIKPMPYPHQSGNRECRYDHVCHEKDCKILQKLCCLECAPYIHPNHGIETIEWFFNHEKEKIKRKEGHHKTALHEVDQLISEWRQKRMKQWKWAVKSYKKIERECRQVEEFTIKKISTSLSFEQRKEAYLTLIRLFKKTNRDLVRVLERDNQDFQIKVEEPKASEEQLIQRQLSDLIDELFVIDYKDKRKVREINKSPSPQRAGRQLRILEEVWQKNIKNVMGVDVRFQTKMLNESRLSLLQKNKITIQLVEADITLEEDENEQAPKVLQVLPVNKSLMITVHPDLIRLWKYNDQTFQDFKPITGLQVNNLKFVTVAPKRQEFLLLHQNQEVWAISAKNTGVINRTYRCPLKSLVMNRILVSDCETMLFASGEIGTTGFYLVYWHYLHGHLLRIIRHPFSFPHNGALLTSFTHQHLFRCNMSTVDIFHLIHGSKIQSLTLKQVKERIDQACILNNFKGSDSICLSTEKGEFYIFSYDYQLQENNYRLMYQLKSGTNSIYHIFYQTQLADEGLFIAKTEDQSTRVYFQLLNDKESQQPFTPIIIEDTITTGTLAYQRDPWRNQLSLILGFQTGLLRILIIQKTIRTNYIRHDLSKNVM